MFKYKPNKVRFSTKVETLNDRHNKIIMQFQKQKDSIPILKEILQKYTEELDEIEKSNMKNFTDKDIKHRSELKEKIKKIDNELKNIDENYDETEYYEKVNDILLEYYSNMSIIPQKKEEEGEDDGNKKTRKIPKARIKNLDDYTIQKSIIEYFDSCHKDGASKNATLLDEYIKITSGDLNKKKSIIRVCSCCHIEKTLIQSDGYYVCPNCGETEFLYTDNETTSYKDSFNEKPSYPYKRMNHLVEWLNQFQAKESGEIPIDVYNNVISEIKKNKLDPNKLSIIQMKYILKKLRLHQYYEHIPHIISIITGTPAPIISKDLENKIKQIFRDIQEPFIKFCPKDRKNFLSYSFVLNKIFELLHKEEFKRYFPLLKSPEKLREQNKIWKKICEYNGYKFYNSEIENQEMINDLISETQNNLDEDTEIINFEDF